MIKFLIDQKGTFRGKEYIGDIPRQGIHRGHSAARNTCEQRCVPIP
ncbi:MAG: hypothetical protein HPY66_0886 [Firmicutes bacterium]|nr:hypothetical protein [Bacillota bacterium]